MASDELELLRSDSDSDDDDEEHYEESEAEEKEELLEDFLADFWRFSSHSF